MSRETNEQLQEEFIIALLMCRGVKKRAAKQVGITPKTVSVWFQDEAFRERVNAYRTRWVQGLFTEGLERAKDGSDKLLTWFLEALEPEVFDPNVRKLKYAKKYGMELPGGEGDTTFLGKTYLIREPAPGETPREPVEH